MRICACVDEFGKYLLHVPRVCYDTCVCSCVHAHNTHLWPCSHTYKMRQNVLHLSTHALVCMWVLPGKRGKHFFKCRTQRTSERTHYASTLTHCCNVCTCANEIPWCKLFENTIVRVQVWNITCDTQSRHFVNVSLPAHTFGTFWGIKQKLSLAAHNAASDRTVIRESLVHKIIPCSKYAYKRKTTHVVPHENDG